MDLGLVSAKSSRGKRQRTPASQLGTRIAFTVIILFVLAQVGWWVLFQERYLSNVTEYRLEDWQRDLETANEALAAGSVAADVLLERYPHLALGEDGRFTIDSQVRDRFVGQQRGYLRMFAYEVPFFVLTVLASLIFIASTLRNERELKRRQQNFMSAVTHEFKTPLSTLRLLVETALMRPLNQEKSRNYLQRMAAEITRLEQTSEQVLASARLEQANVPAPLAPHDLNRLVRQQVEHLRPSLEARGAVVTLELPPEPVSVSLDENAFAIALGNLLDNAVKYTPGDVKQVTVRVENEADLALLHVEDRGVGIPEGERSRIFERFYRSGDEMTREAPGMGLGLHLVRSTVEAMNGWVRCENRDQGGSRFTVVLPLRQAAAGAPLRGAEGAG
ncbi:MAG TPA: HAMP domain-containing sensor histidine kinase [Trueperaceae bacterium]